MIFHRILLLRLCLVSCLIRSSNCHTVLYRTEDSQSVQFYDCIYAPNKFAPYIQYCRQLVESQSLERNFSQSCYNGGKLRSFEELVQWNISVSDVLSWSSSLEQADRYAKYLVNSSLDVGERYLCNCTNPSSFGKFCEYEYYYGEIEFVDAMIEQFKPLETNIIHVGSQLHNNRPCYLTLEECDSGLLCLDWRYICDGKQQCTDGIDEDYCELLEFNECEEDEYRCANGMCIPEEYWLDGGYDCMDWTDEMNIRGAVPKFCFHSSAVICDERLCLFTQWSCGDGVCMLEGTHRHRGDRIGVSMFCENLRDIQFMCEAVTRNSQSWWTINGGYCLPYSLSYQTLGLDTADPQDNCSLSVRCALGRSLNRNCMCQTTAECRGLITHSCQIPVIIFPRTGTIIAPFLYMMYTLDRDWTKKRPDEIVFYGRLKCLDHQLVIHREISIKLGEYYSFYNHQPLAHIACTALPEDFLYRNYFGPQYDANCWNDSKTFNNRPYQVSFLCQTRCISKYRVRDGLVDCEDSEERHDINNSCPQIQRHRLQCSSSELACLMTAALANRHADCSNKRDEVDYETGKILVANMNCEALGDLRCVEARNYIEMSSQKDPGETLLKNQSLADDHSTGVLPFRTYCNSFFDENEGFDELTELCRVWSCLVNQYRCLSGQCIPFDWVCDGEWDCSDASDEQGLFIIDHFSDHNARFFNLTSTKAKCHQRYRRDNTPFVNRCHIESEYPCFRADVADPFNVTLNHPCINLTAIGDGKTDCLTSFDERNRLTCAANGMLGYNYQYNQSECVPYYDLCSGSYRWKPGENDTYGGICFYRRKLSVNDAGSDCDDRMDVMCLNNTCIRNARCNGKMECPYGEDEYRCMPEGVHQYLYRAGKRRLLIKDKIRTPNYPSPKPSLQTKLTSVSSDADHHLSHTVDKRERLLDVAEKLVSDGYLTTVYENRHHQNRSTYEIVRDALPNGTITFKQHYLPFICNRGIAIKYHTGHTVCFCPPSAYGAQCGVFSDRITILTHLNLINYHPISDQIMIIKILVTFLFEKEVIDHHEFHVDPWREKDTNYIKHLIYFLYPRTERFIQMKKSKRNGTQLYSVRFEAFDLYSNGKIQPNGVWHYLIYFDFLPAFRLAKILRFQSRAVSFSDGPCSKNPCDVNGVCQEILNSNRSSYFCSCHSGYYGTECQSSDEECKSYCSPESICKPDYRRMIAGIRRPLCLCPAGRLGSTCFVKRNQCESNPCLHGGTCVVVYNLTNIYNYLCVCSDAFDGNHCQTPRKIVDITVMISDHSMFQRADILATTVFYSGTQSLTLELSIKYQQVFESLPYRIQLINNRYSSTLPPPIGIMKVYGSNYHQDKPEYYLLYLDNGLQNYSITSDLTSENHCPFVHTLWHLLSNVEASNTSHNVTYNSSTAVFFYHNLCHSKWSTSRTLTCFRDSNYLCICEKDHSRAECFKDTLSTDRCSHCLSNGYCLQGDVNVRNDFLCLCPRCHHGKRCEYSTELMSFSLDSLVVKDIQRSQQVSTGMFISITLLIFVWGLFNNTSSFVTFIRPKARKFGVGNYLLIISIIDQCSLLLLLFKFIHIILGTNGTLFSHRNLNLYSCKILSYLLSVFTRLTYWLTSFVSIERLCMVIFPTSATWKNPRLALGLSIFAALMVCSMHMHEVLYYTVIEDLSYTSANVTICVTNYTHSLVSTYNRVNILIHYFVPFLVQTISITIMIIRTASSRARTSGTQRVTFGEIFRQQLRTQKELYITPLIIILSSLPQTILSFSYACGGFNQSWQRYTLLGAYFFSYLPQVLGFILYVLPSTAFSEEFRQTSIGKIVFRQRQSSKIRGKAAAS